MSGLLNRLAGFAGGAMDYEEAKRLAAADSVMKRRGLAARTDVQPEILYFLADDPDAEVRRAVAANDATPVQAGTILAGDADDEVRCSLARRIARLAPELDPAGRGKLHDTVITLLGRLAEDQLPHVRRIVAEELQTATNVPAALIRRLAHDPDLSVSRPVLEFSPLLDDETLLEIIHTVPAEGAMAAVARRHGLGAPVADAIASSDDVDAIAALLGNHSAQIREETLDALVERSVDVEAWHAPLVRRPSLSPRAVRGLARIVASSLLAELARREDIDGETGEAVAAAIERRLDDLADGVRSQGREVRGKPAAARAQRLFADGSLSESEIVDALGKGDRAFVQHALALLSGLSEDAVQQAISLASAKGITAVAWKSGLSMCTATQLQLRLARIPPSKVLQARSGIDYPLSEEEMRWHIEFLEG